jgi:mediator of RNA polymerase II transcription subunit 10
MEKSEGEVETELLLLLQHLTDAMDIMENLEEENRPALVETVRNIVQSFHHLHELEPTITGSVPFELIEQIDQGNNPDDYSKKLKEESELSQRRAEVKKKWMLSFKEALDSSIKRNFEDTV